MHFPLGYNSLLLPSHYACAEELFQPLMVFSWQHRGPTHLSFLTEEMLLSKLNESKVGPEEKSHSLPSSGHSVKIHIHYFQRGKSIEVNKIQDSDSTHAQPIFSLTPLFLCEVHAARRWNSCGSLRTKNHSFLKWLRFSQAERFLNILTTRKWRFVETDISILIWATQNRNTHHTIPSNHRILSISH